MKLNVCVHMTKLRKMSQGEKRKYHYKSNKDGITHRQVTYEKYHEGV